MLVTRIFHLATEKKPLGTWIKKLVLDPDKKKLLYAMCFV